MHKITATAAALVLGVTVVAAATAATAQATTPLSEASSSGSRTDVQVLHFIDKVDSNSNTDIDLGAPGLSAGDQQVFRDRLLQNGHQIGTSSGVAQVVALTETTLTAQVVATATLPSGQLTYQLAFTEVLAEGRPTVLRSAITGGTGNYRNARGECRAQFINGSDDSKVTCTITLDR